MKADRRADVKIHFCWPRHQLKVNVQLHASVTLPLGKEHLVSIWYEVGWTPEPVWTTWRSENSWPYRDSNSNSSVVQPVTSRYIDCSIPAPNLTYLSVCISKGSDSWKRLSDIEFELSALLLRTGKILFSNVWTILYVQISVCLLCKSGRFYLLL
jgi:hypothetical protein